MDELARLARGGDAEALAALCEALYPRLYGFFVKLLGSRQAADDLTQQAIARLLEALPGYVPLPGARFEAWSFKIAYRLFIDHTRGREAAAEFPEPADVSPGPEELALAGERQRLVRAAVARLPNDERALVTLRYGMELSPLETARAAGLSPAASAWRLRRAKARLRRMLADLR